MYVFGVPPALVESVVVPLGLPPLPCFEVGCFGGYFLGLPRFPFGFTSTTTFFAFSETFTVFFCFEGDFPEDFNSPAVVPGSGVGLQLGEVDLLHEVGLRKSLRELSTERGLLREEEEVPPNKPTPPPLPPPPAGELRAGLESKESRE